MRSKSVRWFRTRNSSKLLSARPRAFDSTLLSELRIEIAFQRRRPTENQRHACLEPRISVEWAESRETFSR
jgi:hypothetical protein